MKDINDLYRADPTSFVQRLTLAMGEAEKQDSRLPLGGNQESTFHVTDLKSLMAEPEEETDWLIDNLLPVGGTSIKGAKPKVGKSTMARNMALAVARGGDFLGRKILRPGRVAYLALEEKRAEVRKHFIAMGAREEEIYIHTGAAPQNGLEALAKIIDTYNPVLMIVDPLLRLIRLRDANDYAEVTRALEPIGEIARQSGCHILSVHHLGKADRQDGDDLLGSTALFAAVDTLLLLKRRPQGRTIQTIQRYGTEDMPETVVFLDEVKRTVSLGGELEEVLMVKTKEEILKALLREPLKEPQIREQVGGNQKLTAIGIRELLEEKKISRTGSGKKGDPFIYSWGGGGEQWPG